MRCLVGVADAALAAKIVATVGPFVPTERCSPGEVRWQLRDGWVVFVDEPALSSMTAPPTDVQVVGVAPGSIAQNVESMARFPWLSRLVTPLLFDGPGVGRLIYALARQRPDVEADTLSFLGPGHIRARRVLFYRSSDIEQRLARLEALAESAGARPRAIEQLHDIASELLANAFWDAPFEAGLLSAPPPRQQEIQLPPDLPCELVYGALGDELFVRVRDCFGALTRARLMEVLVRCARSTSAVPLDESRGGAGLGIWRIFRQSSRVVISVSPGASTEVLVTVPFSGLAQKSAREWHLLFAPSPFGAGRLDHLPSASASASARARVPQ